MLPRRVSRKTDTQTSSQKKFVIFPTARWNLLLIGSLLLLRNNATTNNNVSLLMKVGARIFFFPVYFCKPLMAMISTTLAISDIESYGEKSVKEAELRILEDLSLWACIGN